MLEPSLVVAALAPVLRGQKGRNPGDNDDTTRHLSGRSVRVWAFGLAFVFSASRMTTRERAAGKGQKKTKKTIDKFNQIEYSNALNSQRY